MGGGAITLLTGPSGSGKTALCRVLAEEGASSGRDVAGILSPARFEDGRKMGIDAVDLRSGERRPLARWESAGQRGAEHSGSWRFEEATLAWGDALLRTATPCDLLVIDELGPLEWRAGRGWPAGLAAVDSGDYGRALVVVRPTLIPVALARWPRSEVADAGAASTHSRLLTLVRGEGPAGPGPR